jgi:hypothetical protein
MQAAQLHPLTSTLPSVILPRLPQTVASLPEATHYFAGRAQQMRVHGFRWKPEETLEVLDDRDQAWAAATVYTECSSGKDFQALYVYQLFLGQGRYRDYIATCKSSEMMPVVTMTDCEIEDHLAKIGLAEGKNYRVLRGITDTPEYHMISEYYGDEPAKRSGLYLMDHIDQGLYILKEIGASEETMRAFCLHPLYQADPDLKDSFAADVSKISQRAIWLAMEYRNIANAYLSTRTIRSLEDIKLSPWPEVNQMLIADKIQNLKDFIRFHRGGHARRVELQSYFMDWLKRLGVDPKIVLRLFQELAPYKDDGKDETQTYLEKISIEVVRSVQVNLIRDSEAGIEIYLQRRLPSLSSYPDMWVPLGGKVEEAAGKTIYETAVKEAQEEGDVAIDLRTLFLVGTEMTFSGASKRLLLYPKLIADGNGLYPKINSPDESYEEGWFTLNAALEFHRKAARLAGGLETDIPGGIPPGTLKTIRDLKVLQTQGVRKVADILHHFKPYDS